MPRPPLPERLRSSLRLRALDARDLLSGRADRLVPPRRVQYAGHADFAAEGEELVRLAVELAGLKPDHAVLDVGCGAGRCARALTGFLSSRGSYDGLDEDREAIGWCRRRYARQPGFRFLVADGYGPSLHRFPYEGERFDVVLLASALTRMLEGHADHHLAEAARVLRPGGRALLMLFLLDDDSRAAIRDGRAGLAFLDPGQHVAVLSDDVPEEAVAYDVAWLRERAAVHGLNVEEIRPGSWAGREEAETLEDVVVVSR